MNGLLIEHIQSRNYAKIYLSYDWILKLI